MVGIIISVISTAIISIAIANWQMKKNKVVHFYVNSYDIGKGLSNEFPDFQLHYGGKQLVDNVKVLKGGFMNIGRNDSKHNFHEHVTPNLTRMPLTTPN